MAKTKERTREVTIIEEKTQYFTSFVYSAILGMGLIFFSSMFSFVVILPASLNINDAMGYTFNIKEFLYVEVIMIIISCGIFGAMMKGDETTEVERKIKIRENK